MTALTAMFISLAALSAALAAVRAARLASRRARQSLATIDELLTLVERLAEASEVSPVTGSGGRVPASPMTLPPQTPVPRSPGRPELDSAAEQQSTSSCGVALEGITPALRAVVPDLYVQGTPVTEIARRSGLSRGEVKMLIALSERLGRGAG